MRFRSGDQPRRFGIPGRPRVSDHLTPRRVAGASMAVDGGLVAVKLTVGLLTGSLAMVSDAVHSGLDLAASGLALWAVQTSRKPADPEHPYGHGRAENLAAFTEGVILLLAALGIAYEGLSRLIGGHALVTPAAYAIGLMAGILALECGRATLLGRTARSWRSPALAASAQNRRADILSSGGVLAGLLGVRAGLPWADAAAALLVALLVARSASVLLYRAGDILIDRAPADLEGEVRQTITAVEGVRGVGAVRLRRSGGQTLGDARVVASPRLSVEAAQRLSQDVRSAVERAHPGLELAIVVEPRAEPADLVERVHAVAARHPELRDLHNVTVEREEDGRLHVSMHAKLPGEMSLRAACEASAALERGLRQELAQVCRVDVHLEPLEPEVVTGADVTERRRSLAGAVREVVAAHPEVEGCRDVELSARPDGLVAHVVAVLPPEVSLEHAHEVETELEERLRRALPELTEVVARVTP